ncbi:stress-inducible protein, partial [Streptomyces zinciresistens K42]
TGPARPRAGEHRPPAVRREPARTHERRPAEVLEKALNGLPAGAGTQRRAVEGTPRDVLVAATRAADLLVAGAGRRHRRFGPRPGRVAHGVPRHAACPVAVVPEPE